MKQTTKALAGIIGGMGPAASVYLQKLIVDFTPATKDQEHIPYLLHNNPQVPDRTAHLLGTGETPLPSLVKSAKQLKKAGATFLAFPCNTAHAYTMELEKEAGLSVVNMVSLTAKYVAKNFGKNAKIGLLATSGTIATQIFQQEFARVSKNITFIIPMEKDQKEVMKAIYDIKGSKHTKKTEQVLKNVAKKLISHGAQIIIEGCTEIPLAMQPSSCDFPVIDPMELLAREIIKKTLEKPRVLPLESKFATIGKL